MKKLKRLLGLPVYEDESLEIDLTEEPEVVKATLYVDGKRISEVEVPIRRAGVMRIVPDRVKHGLES